MVIGGHSLGGWVAINTAAHDKGLIGLFSISAADMGRLGVAPQPTREKVMSRNMEALAGVTAVSMAADVAIAGPEHPLPKAAPGLVDKSYLAMTADDGIAATPMLWSRRSGRGRNQGDNSPSAYRSWLERSAHRTCGDHYRLAGGSDPDTLIFNRAD